YILNGRMLGYWEDEYTYIGARGNLIIDKRYKKETEIEEQREEETQEEKNIEESWKKIKRIVYGEMVKKKIKGRKRNWNRSRTKEKREVKKMYWRWKREKVEREDYLQERRKFRKVEEGYRYRHTTLFLDNIS
ncbi:hypothetical protein ALC57_09281, partial [Trachymyrmex cornetzi]